MSTGYGLMSLVEQWLYNTLRNVFIAVDVLPMTDRVDGVDFELLHGLCAFCNIRTPFQKSCVHGPAECHIMWELLLRCSLFDGAAV
jgi:hypothetical protein